MDDRKSATKPEAIHQNLPFAISLPGELMKVIQPIT